MQVVCNAGFTVMSYMYENTQMSALHLIRKLEVLLFTVSENCIGSPIAQG